jgi:hypothetical protein
MGLFNFSKYNNIEKALLEQYAEMMTMIVGVSSSEARKMVEDLLDQAIEESKKEGSYYLPQNMGDIILGDAEVNDPAIKKVADAIRKNLPKKRKEGVKDKDIRWWWNLNDIERRIMLKQDDIARMYLFTHEIENSTGSPERKTAEVAAVKVRKFHPIYGDPGDTTHTKGKNRPLPFELKDRINIYIEKRAKTDSEKYKKEIQQSSTFNALVRKEIRAGNL